MDYQVKLRRAEKIEMLEKLTPTVARLLIAKNRSGWSDRDIYDASGVTSNRLSEIKHYENYDRPLNEKALLRLTLEGIIDVNDIVKKVKLTEKELNHLKRITLLDKRVKNAVFNLAAKGLDSGEIAKVLMDHAKKIK